MHTSIQLTLCVGSDRVQRWIDTFLLHGHSVSDDAVIHLSEVAGLQITIDTLIGALIKQLEHNVE